MNRMFGPKRYAVGSRQASSPMAETEKGLIVAYQELCNRHQQIDDFRGKLLALLPIASGAAALVLLRSNSSAVDKYLLPVGVYGMAITAGLFIYELHGIAVCKQIMEQARDLETHLHVPEYSGQYRDRNQNFLHRIIEVEMASWIVYLSVVAGWVYIAGVGGGWWRHASPTVIILTTALLVLLKWIYAVFLEARAHQSHIARRTRG